MANYAIVENDKIINVVVADAKFMKAHFKDYFEITGSEGIGWTLVDGAWTAPAVIEEVDESLA